MGKIIRFTESDLNRIVRRVIIEQTTGGDSKLIAAGFEKTPDILLQDGTYIGNVDGYEDIARTYGLSSIPYLFIFDKNKKFTGYIGKMDMYSRSGTRNKYLTIKNKKINDDNIIEYYQGELMDGPL